MVVAGTRPEALKLAPVVRALRADDRFACTLVTSGQHPTMVAEAFALFGVRADVDLAVHRPGQTPNDIAAAVLAGLTHVVDQLRPAAVVVHGDTTTAMAAALHAFNSQIPVAHVEAGLRSGDLRAPFPEEANRRLISVCADLHLAPTFDAKANLVAEGVKPDHVVVTGNTVVDALRWVLANRLPTAAVDGRVLEQVHAHRGRAAVVTMHRRESWGGQLADAASAIREVVDRHPDLMVVAALHPNPAVREEVASGLAGHPRIVVCDPLGYVAFSHLLERASLVLTDSGGVQEEAASLGVPVVVLRDVTERPEVLAGGLGRLTGCAPQHIVTAATDLLAQPPVVAAENPFGDGCAAARCAAALARLTGIASGDAVDELRFGGDRFHHPDTITKPNHTPEQLDKEGTS